MDLKWSNQVRTVVWTICCKLLFVGFAGLRCATIGATRAIGFPDADAVEGDSLDVVLELLPGEDGDVLNGGIVALEVGHVEVQIGVIQGFDDMPVDDLLK